MDKTHIGFFKFPKDEKMRNTWKRIVGLYRRKGSSDKFEITQNTRICEFHFETKNIRITLGRGIKKLTPGAVPSIFPWKKIPPPGRKPPAKRILSQDFETPEVDIHENNIVSDEKDREIESLKQQIEDLKSENILLKEENTMLKNKFTNASKKSYRYKNIANDPKLFKSETGLETSAFEQLNTLLAMKDDGSNIKFYESKQQSNQPIRTSTNNDKDKDKTANKPGPKVKLGAEDQLFLFLTWLKGGFSLRHTAWLFDISKSTASRYIITLANLLYFTLGSIPIWPSKQVVKETMPKSFKDTYPSTRCIIDCTELFCQRPSSLSSQSHMYSQYKSHVTYKGLLGIAPSGAITFISQLYEGCISDKEIVKRSGLVDERLWDENDSIMADRGFTVADLFQPLKVDLNIPAFLEGRAQFSEHEVVESQNISSVRIHVERAIQRVKKFKQIRNEIPLTLHGTINQIWTVSCLLCNLMPPLIQKDT